MLEMEPLKNEPKASKTRWSHKQVTKLLEVIREKLKGNPESFEKPTAQKFYEAVAQAALMPNVGWITFKHKLRHLKNSYVKAIQWKSHTGSGLLEAGDAKSVVDYLDKICPFYQQLDEIFGSRKNVNVPVIACSDDSIESFLSYNTSDKSYDYSDWCVDTLISEDTQEVSSGNTSQIEFVEETGSENQFTLHTPPSSQSGIKFQVEKPPAKKRKAVVDNPMSTVLKIQNQRLDFEKDRFEWQKEKEKHEMEAKRMELQNQLKLKEMELEMELKKHAQKIEAEKELELVKFEMELKYKYNK